MFSKRNILLIAALSLTLSCKMRNDSKSGIKHYDSYCKERFMDLLDGSVTSAKLEGNDCLLSIKIESSDASKFPCPVIIEEYWNPQTRIVEASYQGICPAQGEGAKGLLVWSEEQGKLTWESMDFYEKIPQN